MTLIAAFQWTTYARTHAFIDNPACQSMPMQCTRALYAHIGLDSVLHNFQAKPAKGLFD